MHHLSLGSLCLCRPATMPERYLQRLVVAEMDIDELNTLAVRNPQLLCNRPPAIPVRLDRPSLVIPTHIPEQAPAVGQWPKQFHYPFYLVDRLLGIVVGTGD